MVRLVERRAAVIVRRRVWQLGHAAIRRVEDLQGAVPGWGAKWVPYRGDFDPGGADVGREVRHRSHCRESTDDLSGHHARNNDVVDLRIRLARLREHHDVSLGRIGEPPGGQPAAPKAPQRRFDIGNDHAYARRFAHLDNRPAMPDEDARAPRICRQRRSIRDARVWPVQRHTRHEADCAGDGIEVPQARRPISFVNRGHHESRADNSGGRSRTRASAAAA